MALIAMCVYSTETNNKDEYLEKTLQSLKETVDFTKHRLQLSVNGYTEKTKELINKYSDIIERVHWNDTNLGTASGINKVWKGRKPNETLIKADDDFTVDTIGWVDLLELGIQRMEETTRPAGICCLKRKDLSERPDRTDWGKSELVMTPSKSGERWLVLEDVHAAVGTCQAYNPKLIDKMGGLYQMGGTYAFDDSISSVRAKILGYHTYFIPEIPIDHWDRGDTPYQKEKQDYAGKMIPLYTQCVNDYKSGKKSVYHEL